MGSQLPIAVCLITADRSDLTERTLAAFDKFNPGLDVIRLHADDGSTTKTNLDLGRAHGFKLMVSTKPHRRCGGQMMRKLIIDEAAARGAEFVMILENDWEAHKPLPLAAADELFRCKDIYAFRMFGTHKQLHRSGTPVRPCGLKHSSKDKDPGWMDRIAAGLHVQVGDIHWGAPPTITRIEEAVWLHEGTRSEADIRRKCKYLDKLTARVVDNVFWHIGVERTPNFKA